LPGRYQRKPERSGCNGYGTQRRREVTSAITTVKAEQFNKGNITDVGQLLQGKVAGLSVSRAGGDPNAGFTLRLRGLSTIGQNTGPLIVLDGLVGADINSVDPNDIKSFDILKDGSAAAIYGTRGSQGVIIITTKTGSRNNSTVTYNGSVSAKCLADFAHMTAQEFRDLGKALITVRQPTGIKKLRRLQFHTRTTSALPVVRVTPAIVLQ
jgi:iron complex outermembrane receptor protein